MGKKYSGRRPEDQPVYTEPTMLDFEKRRLFIPIMTGSPTPHPSLDPSRYDKDLYRTDYGLKWTDLGVITDDAVYTLAYLSNGIVVLGNEGGHIWRSIDFGLTWTDLGAIASTDIFTISYLGNGIALMGDGAGHVFRSTNSGLTWADLGDITSIDIFNIAYLGNGIVVLGDGSLHIWRSTDYGLNWSDLGAVTDHYPNFILYLGSGVAVLGTEDSHVWRSTDYGANWTDLGAFAARAIYSGVYIGNGIAILGDEDGHVWRSSDSGANWSDLGVIASGSIWTIAYLGGGVVVLGDQAYHIHRSTDYGATWTDLGVIAAASFYAMAYLGNGVVLAGGNDDHIYRSTSAFHVWQEGVRQATDVEVSELSTATYDDVQDYINFFGDRTLLSGGGISAHGDADGSVVIASCTAWCKETDSDTAVGKFFDYAGKAKQTLTDLSVNAIYLDYNAGTPQIVVATNYGTYGFQQDHILIGAVYRQGTTVHIFPSSNLGIQGINRTFMHEVEHHGAHRSSGLVTSDGGSRALSITTGVLYAGLNRHTTTIDGSTWSYWYTSDSGSTWTEDAGISALVQSYNNIASGKVALGTNKYGVHWVYVDIDGVHLHIVYGQGNYSANQAEEASVPAVLPPIVTGYCVLIAKIINQEGSNTLTITYPWTTVFTSSLATDHNSLANLTTGDVHTQYIKHALATAASDFLIASGSGVFVKKTLAETIAILQNSINKIVDPTDQDTLVEAEEDQVTMDVAGVEAFLLSTPGIQTLAKQSGAKCGLGNDVVIPHALWTFIKLDTEGYDIQNEFNSEMDSGTVHASTSGTTLVATASIFASGDVNKVIWNKTDDTYTTITAYTNATTVTVANAIFATAEAFDFYFSRFTATEAGKYLIVIGAYMATAHVVADKLFAAAINKNRGTYQAIGYGHTSSVSSVAAFAAAVISLAANDYIEMQVYHNMGVAKTYSGIAYAQFMSVGKVA